MGTFYFVCLTVMNVLVFGLVASGVGLWIGWATGFWNRDLYGDRSETLLSQTPYAKPKWSVFEFILMLGLSLTFQIFAFQLLVPGLQEGGSVEQAVQEESSSPTETVTEGDASASKATDAEIAGADVEEPDDPKAVTAIPLDAQLSVTLWSKAGALLVMLAWLYLVLGISPKDLGLAPSARTIRHGLVATVWILSPVLLVNLVVVQFVKYEHPVMDLLAKENSLGTFVSMMVCTALVVPIFEELMFRGLLQGGLQRAADLLEYEGQKADWSPRMAWPILLTSLLFALAHYGQGAAPIPLFFLSVGLGYLYQARGSLIPCIIVHVLLNGATLVMAFCRANAGLPPPS